MSQQSGCVLDTQAWKAAVERSAVSSCLPRYCRLGETEPPGQGRGYAHRHWSQCRSTRSCLKLIISVEIIETVLIRQGRLMSRARS